jgi:hypothetical protein
MVELTVSQGKRMSFNWIRFITFLKASDNNLADTVHQLFVESCSKYGVPEKVRGDRGVENVQVRDYMQSLHGPKGFLSGRSCHNQRIERLWRDVYERVVCVYHDLFQSMEERGVLDPETDKDIVRRGIFLF